MLSFPGQNTDFLCREGTPLYREPLPEIGKAVTCKVVRVTPTAANLVITHVNGEKCSVEYKAVLRSLDLQVNIAENQFVWDVVEQGAVVDAKIVSYGDANGMYVSCMPVEFKKI